jgi:hypothetical protein
MLDPSKPWHIHVLPLAWLHCAPAPGVTVMLLILTRACPVITVKYAVDVKFSVGIVVVNVYAYEPGEFGAVKLHVMFV